MTQRNGVQELVAVNARAPFLMMRAAADQLADGGRVVNISSGLVCLGWPGVPGLACYESSQ